MIDFWKIKSWLYQNFRDGFPFKQILQQENKNYIRFFEKINVEPEFILDIGTGHGNGLQLIEYFCISRQTRGASVSNSKKNASINGEKSKNSCLIGVDRSASMLKQAREVQSGTFIQAEALQLPFKNNSFSIILVIGLIEYLKDKELFLKELNRILKPRGNIILTISPVDFFSFFRFFYGLKLYLISVEKFEFLLNLYKLKVQKKAKSIMQIQYLIYKL